jgi:hypothetical protein
MKKKNTVAQIRSNAGSLLPPKNGKPAAHRSRAAPPALHVLFGKTVEFLLDAGEFPEDIAFELAEQARRLSGREPLLRAEDVQHVERVYERFADACGVTHDWHREPAYTNGDGDPLQLSRESFHALVGKRVPKERSPALIRWMMANGIVRKTKRRKFALNGGRTVIFEKHTARQLLLDRAAKLVPEYLRTELRNASTQDPCLRDINRDARVLFLPEKYVPLWREVVRERAGTFLEGLDNWLEDHARRDDPGPVCEVAAHCYAHTRNSRAPKVSKIRVHRFKRGRLSHRASRKYLK